MIFQAQSQMIKAAGELNAVWQKATKHCKAICLQLKNRLKIKYNTNTKKIELSSKNQNVG